MNTLILYPDSSLSKDKENFAKIIQESFRLDMKIRLLLNPDEELSKELFKKMDELHGLLESALDNLLASPKNKDIEIKLGGLHDEIVSILQKILHIEWKEKIKDF